MQVAAAAVLAAELSLLSPAFCQVGPYFLDCTFEQSLTDQRSMVMHCGRQLDDINDLAIS